MVEQSPTLKRKPHLGLSPPPWLPASRDVGPPKTRAPGVDAALCKTKKTQCCRDALLRGRRASCRCVPVIGRAETPRPPCSAPLPRRQTDRRTGQRPGPRRVPGARWGQGEERPPASPRPRPPARPPVGGWPAHPSWPTRAPECWANGRLVCVFLFCSSTIPLISRARSTSQIPRSAPWCEAPGGAHLPS